MTEMIVSSRTNKQIVFSDSRYKPVLNKPTLSIVENNVEHRVASFVDFESMKEFLILLIDTFEIPCDKNELFKESD